MSGSSGEPTVLVADDDADIREMLSIVLEMNHVRVIGAGDGREVLDRAKDTPDLALVLLDLMMPGMNGAEVLRLMRRDPALAKIPVVVLSGDRSARETASTFGAAGCLMKPIELDDLMKEVRRFVSLSPET